ncbi:MAG: hypothetical protein ACK56F_05400, partial [bacterium]
CILFECSEELKTLEENLITIKLCSQKGIYTYLDPTLFKNNKEALKKQIPITIIINNSPE